MLGLHKDKVSLVPHSSNWHKEFEQEKEKLQTILGNIALAIEHIGSTSIPGLSAKPILDIAVAVENIEALKSVIPILTEAEYDILDSIETKGEVLARKGTPDNRTHYIHVEIFGDTYWNNHIMFRDFLLKHQEYVEAYEKLKKDLAIQFSDDRKKYTDAKNDFIQNVLKLAQKDE